jgi:DNA helicase II / ATP-dependent DNA helicase PcrA
MNIVTSSFAPSKYQTSVFEWVQNGTGHAVIKAVPGSGKSTTLIHASKLLKTSNAVFLAFNKSIEVELNDKLQEQGSMMRAQTINAFGFSALRATGKKYKVEGNKYYAICKEYLYSVNAYEYKLLQKLKKLVSLVRMTLCDVKSEKALVDLALFYDIDFDVEEWDVVARGIGQIIATGNKQAKDLCIIDYDDQIYLPIIWNLTPDKKDFIFIDECQDLNAARLELIIRSVNGKGRLLFVGDECQSIYGFCGADTQSINKIIERTKATVLPLSICYRCPSSHIELCASIFPGLEARENAPEGTIEDMAIDNLYEKVRPGDLVLCRMNAPLVSTCLDLIRSGVRAKVRGSDIGANFIATIKKLEKQYPTLSIETFSEIINSYRDTQAIMIGVDDDADMKIAALDDRVDTMKALRDGYCGQSRSWSLDAFYAYIENFFSDEQGALVILSTVHKAKGLENERVFILHPDRMPHPKAKPGWQYEQELNIKYVAYSRSKSELYLVHDVMPALQSPEEVEEEVIEPVVEQHKVKLGRPGKDNMKRVCIKMDKELIKLTEGIDRSALIEKLLREHFGV